MHKCQKGHRSEENTPLGRHFARCGYQNVSIQMIDGVKQGEDEAIFIVEDIWQNMLSTFKQHWIINVRNEIAETPGQQPYLLFFNNYYLEININYKNESENQTYLI